MSSYKREYDYFYSASKHCAEQIETDLKGIGIRAIISHRAKSLESLLKKLIERDEKQNYQNRDEVYSDIADLSGVRVAIYFPQDKDLVVKYLEDNFTMVTKKSFPRDGSRMDGNYRFPGYVAEHCRLKIPPEKALGSSSRYCETMIEVQVASVLMHGWSEVEHDITYKPQNGLASEQEAKILDQINGMVIACEMALDNLKYVIEERVKEKKRPFANPYEMAAFISDYVRQESANQTRIPVVNRPSFLFNILTENNINTPDILSKLLKKTNFSRTSNLINISIIEQWLSEDPTRFEIAFKYIFAAESHAKISTEGIREDIFEFLKAYALLLGIVRQLSDIKLSRRERRGYKLMSRHHLEALGFKVESVSTFGENVGFKAWSLFNGSRNMSEGDIDKSLIEITNLISGNSDISKNLIGFTDLIEILHKRSSSEHDM